MFTKIFILVIMFIIAAALASGLVFLVRDGNKTKRTVHALTMRIALSLGLFVFLLLAYHANWLRPHGV